MMSIVGNFDVASDASPEEKTAGNEIGGEKTIDRQGNNVVEGSRRAYVDEA